ncbi:TPA: hypothetical protein NIC91_003228 [Pseudomonas aeruginosa]|nr:hypothetical protein [Pseudomonas aeruginosa]
MRSLLLLEHMFLVLLANFLLVALAQLVQGEAFLLQVETRIIGQPVRLAREFHRKNRRHQPLAKAPTLLAVVVLDQLLNDIALAKRVFRMYCDERALTVDSALALVQLVPGAHGSDHVAVD